jgi:hypothetical protein
MLKKALTQSYDSAAAIEEDMPTYRNNNNNNEVKVTPFF